MQILEITFLELIVQKTKRKRVKIAKNRFQGKV